MTAWSLGDNLPICNILKEIKMKWSEPDFCDVRLGFEVTAYVYVR
ncbi:pyrroloquinoline quinone precursor peptide PqqA [Novimethylophilus sp.]|jgi:pyrroloquinoline quinone biosynthesis protein A